MVLRCLYVLVGYPQRDRAFLDGLDRPQAVTAMFAVRGADGDKLCISAELYVDAGIEGAEADVYVPTTAIAFDDGVTIPLFRLRQTGLSDWPAKAADICRNAGRSLDHIDSVAARRNNGPRPDGADQLRTSFSYSSAISRVMAPTSKL